jgi:hypothetical protein
VTLHDRALDRIAAELDRARPGWADDSALVAEARRMSEGYTERRVTTPANRAEAYLAYFAPRTVAAMARVAPLVPFDGVRVLELGSGTGAASLVCALAGAKALTLCEPLLDARQTAHRLLTGLADVEQREKISRSPGAEVALAAFSWGEIFPDTAPRDALDQVERLAPRARDLVILEPGDRASSRRVLELRAAALDAGWRALAPCPHEAACPALERAHDWCHTFVDRALPERFAAFARQVGRDPDRMALTYLVLSKRPDARPSGGARVLSGARVEKGRARAAVCAAEGVRSVQALKRHKPAFAALKGLERGDVLRLDGLEVRGDTAHLESPESLDVDDGVAP